ncbi:hypothetical protein Q6245_28480, partial [Klebsiella pneumoniae]|uniref:hypothetical protein n=1 Tax=Klebsiella pneumoniae TaxID=573 RepID=UPI002731CC17
KVQVIGKIDLDALNTKTRPDKKKKEETPVEKEVEKTEPVKEKEPVVEKKEEPKVVVEPTKPAADSIETIRVQSQTLSGPKVLGKIE